MKNLTPVEKFILVVLFIGILIFFYIHFFKNPKQTETENKKSDIPLPGSNHKPSENSHQQTSSDAMEQEWKAIMPSLIEQARFKDNKIVNTLIGFEDPAIKKVIIEKAIQNNKPLEQEILESAMYMIQATAPKQQKAQSPPQKFGTTIQWDENPDAK